MIGPSIPATRMNSCQLLAETNIRERREDGRSLIPGEGKLMRRSFAKAGVICVALVMALANLGVGLAYWTETLTISGTVTTGVMDCHFAKISCTDNETPCTDSENCLDVGSCTWIKTGDKSLAVTVDNGYPGYECTLSFDMANGGTIPEKIKSIDIDDVDDGIEVTVGGISEGDFIPVGNSVSGSLEILVSDDDVDDSFTVTIETIQWNAP